MSTSGGSGGGIPVATAHLNTAAIAALFTAPTVLIGAPGAGKLLAVQSVIAEYKAGVGTWDAQSLGIYYAAPLGSAVNLIRNLAVLGGNNNPAASDMYQVANPPASAVELFPATARNQPIVIGNSTADPVAQAPIVTSTLAAGGLLYAPNDTGTIEAGDSGVTDATYKVLTVGAGGAVLTYQITNPGTLYDTVSNPVATAVVSGGGDGNLAFNIASVASPGGDLYITCSYRIITLH